jgi:hypothetical protein
MLGVERCASVLVEERERHERYSRRLAAERKTKLVRHVRRRELLNHVPNSFVLRYKGDLPVIVTASALNPRAKCWAAAEGLADDVTPHDVRVGRPRNDAVDETCDVLLIE